MLPYLFIFIVIVTPYPNSVWDARVVVPRGWCSGWSAILQSLPAPTLSNSGDTAPWRPAPLLLIGPCNAGGVDLTLASNHLSNPFLLLPL